MLKRSRLKAVFLTNDFDDPLSGFDPDVFVPCLRTDELVFQLARPAVRERLERASGVSVDGPAALVAVLGKLFEHFVGRGARACAISLPSSFAPTRISAGNAARAWRRFGAAVKPAMRTRGASWPISSSGRWPNTAPRIGCHST